MNFEELKNPPKKYLPTPLRSGEAKPDTQVIKKQISDIAQADIGGRFVKCLGEKYQQKNLRYEKTEAPVKGGNTVGNEEFNGQNYHFYYELNPFCVNTIDTEVVEDFIRDTHKKHKDTMGENFVDIADFFADPPQALRNGLPWSDRLLWLYHKTYGMPLKGNLKCLFFDEGEYRRVRYCYWKLIRELFAESYALCGFHKRNYPDAVGRIGMLVAEGQINYEVLVLDTIESGWLRQTDGELKEANDICDRMLAVMETLEAAQIQYHLGDSRIMQRHATVEDGRLIIGTQRYSVVVVPPCDCLGDITCNLLEEFKRQGGKIIFVDEIPKYLAGFESDRFKRISEGCFTVSTDTLIETLPEEIKKIKKCGKRPKTT